MIIWLQGCKKEKIDFTYDNTLVQHERSSARVINLGSYYSQVMINGRYLTNAQEPGKGTLYFPYNGMLGQEWWIPKDLFDGTGKVDIELWGEEDGADYTNEGKSGASFTVADPQRQGIDYYTIRPYGTDQPFVVPVSRDNTPPANPAKFKIRILNLMKNFPKLRYSGRYGERESLYGPITLTYADGTPVDPKTSNISLAKRVSDYVELPYGTYQFKVLAADGRQISAFNKEGTPLHMDPTFSTVQIYESYEKTRSTFAPVKAFQPGGVYTIVVSPVVFSYNFQSDPFQANMIQNGFGIVNDIDVKGNTSFARLQVVNAFADKRVSFRLNNSTLASQLPFGTASDYSIQPVSTTTLQAFSETGKMIAEKQIELSASQNITVWLYPNASGEATLEPVVNDLSGEVYFDRNQDNGTVNSLKYDMPIGTRFLNLCPNVDNLNFTISDGQNVLDEPFTTAYGLIALYLKHSRYAMYDLKTGYIFTDLPYVWWNYNLDNPFELMAFQSKPGIAPGSWLKDVQSLKSQDLIQKPDLYTKANRSIPPYEAGIYTIALIGRMGKDVPDNEKARIIYIKHTK